MHIWNLLKWITVAGVLAVPLMYTACFELNKHHWLSLLGSELQPQLLTLQELTTMSLAPVYRRQPIKRKKVV